MVETQKFSGSGRPPGGDGTLQVGGVLQGRYKIVGVLGVGGMGSVYQARDMHFPTVQRIVAVKEMLNLASDPNLREMTLKNFEREANILAELSHPAIPKIYDYFSNKDRAYLVMEYINGKDLEAIINSVADFLPVDLVFRWSLELCDVLSYLHMHQPEPIIFRDVKPSNVMIDQHGKVRLIDFGIAKAFQVTQAKGTMIGTEGYSPPEQYKGEASPAGDIYALGATLHHILTRRDPRLEPPFSFAERPIRATNVKVTPEFEAIINRALSYEMRERFPTAAAMKEALEQLSAGTAMPALSSGGARPGTGPHASTPVQGATSAEGDAEFGADAGKMSARWKFKCEDEIRSTPVVFKGTVFVGAYDNNLYALNAQDGTFKWKFATDGGIVGTPAIAPDENIILVGSEDHNLYAIDIRTGKISWSFQTGGPIRSSIQATHGIAFVGSDDGKMYAVRLMNGRLVWKYEAGVPLRSRPAVTAERVAFGTESGDVLGLDLSGALKWRFKAKRAVSSNPAVHEDIAYFGSLDWHVYSVDVNTGWTIWRYRTGKPIISSPIIVGKQLFIGSADNNLYSLDISANGKELWRFETQGQVVSTPAHSNGAIYFGSVDKNVYCIDMKKGKLRWSFETGGPIASSASIADGILYIGSTDNYIYALNP